MEKGFSPAEIVRVNAGNVETRFALLAEQHLSKWDDEKGEVKVKADQKAFESEETELLTVEKIRTMAMQDVQPQTLIGRQELLVGKDRSELATWGEVVGAIKEVIKQNSGRANVLVTGLPISGKATVRRLIVSEILKDFPAEEVTNIDRDYIKSMSGKLKNVNIIEDMHGLDQSHRNYADLSKYNLVVYILPTEVGHLNSISSRGEHWVEADEAKVDLTDGPGGTDNGFKRTIQAMNSMSRAQRSRKHILSEDEEVLAQLMEKQIPVLKLDPAVLIEKGY